MKKKLSLILTMLMLGTALCSLVPSAEEDVKFDHDEEYAVSGFDTATNDNGVFIYPNNSAETRVIGADDYGFRQMNLLIFNAEGLLIEAGGQIYANTNGMNGSPQLTVKVPAGGFLVAYGNGAPGAIRVCKATAMEGAVLYNATMSVIYEVHGEYDQKTSKLRLRYNDPKKAPENAVKFLFVGNSSTYFNGSPIKFKGLCLAAGKAVTVDYCTFGSAFLHEFADPNHERGRSLRAKLSNNKYDYVVLQDAAAATYEDSLESIRTIMPLIEENGAKPLMYMRYSSSVDIDDRIMYAKKYHDHYTSLAAVFNAGCAPVADSFIICAEQYPQINLYADDHSHHSAEGSYLMACVWLYSYLGIDPRGNTYTANLDQATVSALQKVAYTACTEGYTYTDPDSDKVTIDGKEYFNVAKDCAYIVEGAPYSGAWTDTGSDGNPLGKLTDGTFSASGDDTTNACYKGSTVSVTIDLGVECEIKRILTDVYGNEGWGIASPGTAAVSIEVSDDGKEFRPVGSAERSGNKNTGSAWEKREFTLDVTDEIHAKYVKVIYTIDGNFLWTSEISVFGSEYHPNTDLPDDPISSEPDESSDGASSDDPADPGESVDPSADGESSSDPVEGSAASDPAEQVSGASSESDPEPEVQEKPSNTPALIALGVLGVAAVALAAFIIIKNKKFTEK